jgi:hypothetical protein
VITCKATGFYVRDCIIKAKEIVYEELEISSRMMNHTKKEDNVEDIYKMLVAAAKKAKPIPKFVILSPCQTPAIGDAVFSTLISEVNEMARKVDGLVENMSQSKTTINDIFRQQFQKPTTITTHAVVLRNCLKNMVSSSDRQTFVDSLYPEE